ncbi:LysM peptidoglycan-binding domain-containing protein [Limnochorda pilosa]|uniref:Peptidoglycan-binding protein n=1 Tax=Limnochorda pilosa TaxID=1555112 RepID=A0A0K2SMX5_LIMPI|nr:LysM peptidoglycan-binding domain-containing protein [Limnochorda pilosa]BAS28357.1 peptidoglycan-binding protein [Limnochorda pilosa]
MRPRVSLAAAFLALALTWPAAPVGAQGYRIQPGDSLYLIAQRFGTTVDRLRQANNLWTTSEIRAGGWLALPGGLNRAYTVQPGDSLFIVAQKTGTTVEELRRLNNLWGTDEIWAGQVLAVPTAPSPPPAPEPPAPRVRLSPEELDLLSRLVTAEAEGEAYAGQVAVAATVLNRVLDPRYPNTVWDVVYQYWQGIPQFSPVADGRINLPASPVARQAVAEALTGKDPASGALGFYNPLKTSNAWVRSQPVTAAIGNHLFFTVP